MGMEGCGHPEAPADWAQLGPVRAAGQASGSGRWFASCAHAQGADRKCGSPQVLGFRTLLSLGPNPRLATT